MVKITRVAVPPSIDTTSEEARNLLEWIELHARRLDVIVSVHRTGEGTTVYVRGQAGDIARRAIATRGAVLGFVSRTLDEWKAKYGETWTTEELVQIAHQSGLDVTRA